MPAKLRIYLDTSVFSAYFDDRVPDRQAETVTFWRLLSHFETSTSELALQELGQTPEQSKRDRILALLKEVSVVSVTKEMEELAHDYVAAGAFTSIMYNDALHVAAAVISRQDVLLSWNFKHLVNRRRRAMINQVNTLKGLPPLEILAPPEV